MTRYFCQSCQAETSVYTDGLDFGLAEGEASTVRCSKCSNPATPLDEPISAEPIRTQAAPPAVSASPPRGPRPRPLIDMIDDLRSRRDFVVREIATRKEYEHELEELDAILSRFEGSKR